MEEDERRDTMEEEKVEEKIEEKVEKKRGRPKGSKIKKKDEIKTNTDLDNIEKEVDAQAEELIKKEDTELEQVEEEIKPALTDNMPYPQSIDEKVDDVIIEETKEDLGFWKKIFKKEKVKKEGMVAVLLLHPNTSATRHYIETKNNGEFWIDKYKYHVNEHCLYNLQEKKDRIPLCILPTWTMIPVGTKAWFDLTQERRGHELEMILVNSIINEEIVKVDDTDKKKKGMNAKTIWIILAVLVGFYIFMRSRGGG